MNYPKLIASIALCFFVAFSGSMVTTPAITSWYAGLEKPFFNPPNWIFGPVWTVLYLLMGISFYRVWNNVDSWKKEKKAITAFFVQLFLNFLWSLVFFGFEQPVGAFFVILLLWLAIFYTIKSFMQIDKTAAYLLIPYLLWVSFASVLNIFIAALN
jgi:tryptophan-rich sensory protein